MEFRRGPDFWSRVCLFIMGSHRAWQQKWFCKRVKLFCTGHGSESNSAQESETYFAHERESDSAQESETYFAQERESDSAQESEIYIAQERKSDSAQESESDSAQESKCNFAQMSSINTIEYNRVNNGRVWMSMGATAPLHLGIETYTPRNWNLYP